MSKEPINQIKDLMKGMPVLDSRPEMLAAAIIGQAIRDYIVCGHFIDNNPLPPEVGTDKRCRWNENNRLYHEAKHFFTSDDFYTYCPFKVGEKIPLALMERMDKYVKCGPYVIDAKGKKHKVTTKHLNAVARELQDAFEQVMIPAK